MYAARIVAALFAVLSASVLVAASPAVELGAACAHPDCISSDGKLRLSLTSVDLLTSLFEVSPSAEY